MAYLGRTQLKAADIKLKAATTISGSSTNTVVLTWEAPNEQSLILKVNGVTQNTTDFTISGSPTTITLASGNFADGSVVEVVGINDIGTPIVPADGSVTALKLADDSVTAAKLDTTGTPTGSKFLQDDMAWTTVDSLPSQTSQSGKFLTTDGSAASWGAVASSGFVAVTFYTDTSGDTWSKSTNNPTKIIVEVISGAGGSGAGASGSGGSGGAGSYGMAFIDVSTVDTATITVGAGGAAGSSGAGGTGGTSKFTYATGTGPAFTEMECPGGNGGGHANHTGGSTTSLPTGPTNGVYVAGNGGGGASNSGGVSHGYGASQMGGYTYNAATGYGSASSGSASTTAGRAGRQGMVVVWEYK